MTGQHKIASCLKLSEILRNLDKETITQTRMQSVSKDLYIILGRNYVLLF